MEVVICTLYQCLIYSNISPIFTVTIPDPLNINIMKVDDPTLLFEMDTIETLPHGLKNYSASSGFMSKTIGDID